MIIDKEGKSIWIEQRDVNYILPAYIISYLFQNQNEDPGRIIFPMYPSVPHPRNPEVLIPIEYVPPDSSVAVEIKEDGSNVAEASEEEIRRIDEKEDEIRKLKEQVAELSKWNTTGDEVTPTPEDLIRQHEEADMPEVEVEVEVEGAPESTESKTVTLEPEEEVSPARAAFAEEEPPTEEQQVEEPSVAAEPEPTCPLCGQPSIDGKEHKECMDREAMLADQPEPTQPDRVPKQPPGGALPPGTPLDDMQSRGAGFERKIAQDLQPQAEVNEEEERETNIEKPTEE